MAAATAAKAAVSAWRGPLAILPQNRFLHREVTGSGEVHRGEHEPILTATCSRPCSEKLAANLAVAAGRQRLGRPPDRPPLRRCGNR